VKHTYLKVTISLCMIVLLTGCLYPSNKLSENQMPYEDQLEIVQNAVNSYQSNANGALPIVTKENDTPIFEKYIIDFQMMKDQNVLSSIPSNAFESGGIYKYVLIHPDDDPQVKLIDLNITEEIRKIYTKISSYRSKHLYPPFGKEIAKDVYTINYEKIGMEHEPYIVSPYSQKNLPIVLAASGDLYVDYRIDLKQALTDHEHDYKNGDDIRYIIAENSPFVPVYSLPYTIEDDQPVFDTN